MYQCCLISYLRDQQKELIRLCGRFDSKRTSTSSSLQDGNTGSQRRTFQTNQLSLLSS
jgi:hypothetical protein